MTPTLNVLPHCSLALRPLRSDGAAHERAWMLCSRDDRARAMWEVVLTTPALIALLECLSEGQATADAGGMRIAVYPDPVLERAVAHWATQQLARYAGLSTPLIPQARGVERISTINPRLV